MDERDPGDGSEPLIGRYSNYFRIGFNAFEVVIDFGQCYEGCEPQMHTRIVSGPVYLKVLSDLLLSSIADYQQRHGEIKQEPEQN